MVRVSRVVFVVVLLLSGVAPVFAQAQAVNGTIEGTISDQSDSA